MSSIFDLPPQDQIATLKRHSGRDCGSCSMCCCLLEIEDLNKPADKWCGHCRPGNGGCSIYADRPEVCRNFACQWLINEGVPDFWFPKKSKMVLQLVVGETHAELRVHVDDRFPNQWREDPYISWLREEARKGFKSNLQFSVYVFVGHRQFLIQTHGEVETTKGGCGLVRVDEDEFECMVLQADENEFERIETVASREGRQA